MHRCIDAQMHTYMHTQMDPYITYIHAHIHTYIDTYILLYIHAYIHAYLHALPYIALHCIALHELHMRILIKNLYSGSFRLACGCTHDPPPKPEGCAQQEPFSRRSREKALGKNQKIPILGFRGLGFRGLGF